jgi:hypothetical protein
MMMVVYSPSHLHVLMRSSKLLVDTEVVYFIFGDMIRRYPGGFVYPLVDEDAASDDKVVQSTEVGEFFSVFVHLSEGMLPITSS